MKFRWTRIAVFAMMFAPFVPSAQVGLQASSKTGSELMEIVLEKKTGDVVQAMAAGHVFQTGDILRFRLRPAFDGFLYVTDLGTSGKSSLLFPKQETGSDNRIEHAREYVVPATPDGWFEVSGPPGYETLYFVMSPVALAGGTVPSAAPNAAPNPNQGIPQGTPPPTMHPRCNDEIFKSRGDCVDPNAGPKRVDPSAPLPGQVRDLFGDISPREASRDLNFTQKSSSSVVTSVSPMTGPVVYEFLLAHN
jgi:Domain of unknown function (DUF4384)